ncbi:unnamed protein product [Cyclocybe aegerita]|uniref:Sensitive to high expression protein 9, mitochondrial n=1 Tax=Cyclocybe aegerita TaxID=1973307 RepID=A0A8S0W8K2_CYCAE|nr:unnamed protein product [Cyclocybe aegerita]
MPGWATSPWSFLHDFSIYTHYILCRPSIGFLEVLHSMILVRSVNYLIIWASIICSSPKMGRRPHRSFPLRMVTLLPFPMLRTFLSRPLLLLHDAQSKEEPSTPERPNAGLATESRTESPLVSDILKARLPGSQEREPLSSYDLDLVKKRIREWTEQASIAIRNRADDFTVNTKTTFSQLGAHLNKVTGYEEIEALKRGVVEQEERINAVRQAARKAKSAYEEAVVQRSNSQREVNDLLQRKSMWTDGDVGRFTSLVRQDHLYEQEEARAKAAVDETEDAVEKEFSRLMRTILARYHEEQVWSDKIRSASTYGSLAALGLNLFVFILAIVIVEPWKRRRLAQTFERKIEELSEENGARLDASMKSIGSQIVRQEALLEDLKGELSKQLALLSVSDAAHTVNGKGNGTLDEPSMGEEVESVQPGADTATGESRPSRRQLEIAAVGAAAALCPEGREESFHET